MTENSESQPDTWSSAESGRHDPLLRLDQMISRQDETIRLLRAQNEILKMIVFTLALLVLLALTLMIYLVWH